MEKQQEAVPVEDRTNSGREGTVDEGNGGGGNRDGLGCIHQKLEKGTVHQRGKGEIFGLSSEKRK